MIKYHFSPSMIMTTREIEQEIDRLLDELNDYNQLYALLHDDEYRDLAVFTKQALSRMSKRLHNSQLHINTSNYIKAV